MNNFIKATEIWIPDPGFTKLSLKNGEYGENEELESVSQGMTFAYDEGLPGKAWAQRHPIILTDLEGSFFKRTELVMSLGLTAAIAMPIFAGEYLRAVVVFFCGSSEAHAGAIEVWRATPDRVHEMELVNGYYGTMADFEWISRRTKIMKGQGLPGSVWKRESPVMMGDLRESATFMRSAKAVKEGITTAFGIPAWIDPSDGYVMTFLSAKGTPIARRFEIWETNHEDETLHFVDGYSHGKIDLVSQYEEVAFAKEDSLLGKTWTLGRPLLSENFETVYAPKDCNYVLTLPIIQYGICKTVIAFYY
jgi:hypothetical protein